MEVSFLTNDRNLNHFFNLFFQLYSGVINTKIFKREISSQENITFPLKSGTLERQRVDSVGSNTSSTTPEPRDDMNTSNFLPGIKRSSMRRNKIFTFFDSSKESERLIKLSNVLLNQDGTAWDWDTVVIILKCDMLIRSDDNHARFIKRLVHYFKPSNNRFSHQDLGHGRHIPSSVLAGVELIDWLLQTMHEV